jgi:hypothetical protein
MVTVTMITITRLYDSHDDAVGVVKALRDAGLSESDISVLTRDNRTGAAAKGAEIGAVLGGLTGLLTGLGLLAIPGIGPVMAGGWLASTLAGAAAGGWAGGALGVLTHVGVTGEDAHAFAECLRRGATLVAARVPEGEKSRFETILDRGAIDLEVRVATFRREGWSP